jgi:membrane-bound lytic murein transglycosylase D
MVAALLVAGGCATVPPGTTMQATTPAGVAAATAEPAAPAPASATASPVPTIPAAPPPGAVIPAVVPAEAPTGASGPRPAEKAADASAPASPLAGAIAPPASPMSPTPAPAPVPATSSVAVTDPSARAPEGTAPETLDDLVRAIVGQPHGDLWQRLRAGFRIADLDDPLVGRRERYFGGQPEYLRRMTERAGRYLYYIVEEVERRGLPSELALLPFIESAFNPQALSSAKASGIWQFMPATGRHFDLTQNLFRDDRRDLMASRRAPHD